VVVGLDSTTGLQAARIFAWRGIPVVGVAEDPAHFCCRTRVCQRIVRADHGGDALIEALVELGSSLGQKAVLVPCNDDSVLAIARRRGELEQAYHVALPETDVVELLSDKAKFATYAKEQGLPIPETMLLTSREDGETAADSLRFPIVVKPAVKTATWKLRAREKAFKVETGSQLLALYDELGDAADVLVAQEWISGSEGDHFTCNAYFDREARPLVTFVTRKIRQWPPQTGEGCLAVEWRNDAVRDETVRLFSGVGFWGLAYLELKRDAETGEHLIVEPNIGRPTGRSATAEAGGVELLYAMYCDILGLPLPADLTQRYVGAKWIYFGRDLRSSLHYWRRGELSVRGWIKSLRGPKVDAVFSWRDPVPFCFDVGRVFSLSAGRTEPPWSSVHHDSSPRAACPSDSDLPTRHTNHG
jgi:D-aspartate ligase